MQIARIQKMSFFDVAKPMDRSQQTLFSLDIDGVTVFSKSIFGYPSLKAVQNTVGAFKTQSKDSIIAWIDPISGEFFLTADDGLLEPGMMVPALVPLVMGVCVYMTGLLRSPAIELFAIPVLVGVWVGYSLKKRAEKKLELALREELTKLV